MKKSAEADFTKGKTVVNKPMKNTPVPQSLFRDLRIDRFGAKAVADHFSVGLHS